MASGHINAFVTCIREGRESPHNLADAMNAHLACIAICQSAARGGEKVRIEGDRLV